MKNAKDEACGHTGSAPSTQRSVPSTAHVYFGADLDHHFKNCVEADVPLSRNFDGTLRALCDHRIQGFGGPQPGLARHVKACVNLERAARMLWVGAEAKFGSRDVGIIIVACGIKKHATIYKHMRYSLRM